MISQDSISMTLSLNFPVTSYLSPDTRHHDHGVSVQELFLQLQNKPNKILTSAQSRGIRHGIKHLNIKVKTIYGTRDNNLQPIIENISSSEKSTKQKDLRKQITEELEHMQNAINENAIFEGH